MKRTLAVMLLLCACSKSVPPSSASAATGSDATTSAQSSGGTQMTQPTGPTVRLPDGFVVRLEVVADDEARAQGLMFRDQLRPGAGMLFVFPEDGEYAFWMKNTLIPLDMIWIDAERRIVHIKESVPPCKVPDCPSYPPGVPSRYVLELGGGEAAKHALRVGDVVTFDDISHIQAR